MQRAGASRCVESHRKEVEEPLDAARTRSQPERPLRPGKATGRCREGCQAHGLSGLEAPHQRWWLEVIEAFAEARAGARRCEAFEGFEGGRRRSRNRKKRLCGHPAARGWKVFLLELLQGWRRLEEPLDAARTRSQPERPLRPGKATGRCREGCQAHGLSGLEAPHQRWSRAPPCLG